MTCHHSTGWRDLQHGPEVAPVWHCITTPPQCERPAREFLRQRGIFAFYPSEEKEGAKRRRDGTRIKRERPLVGGLVFARFNRPPQWDVIKAFRFFGGPFCVGETPYTFGRETMRRLQGLTVEAEKLRQERAELMRINVGDLAKIDGDLFHGKLVRVLGLRETEADVEIEGERLPVRMTVAESKLEKVQEAR